MPTEESDPATGEKVRLIFTGSAERKAGVSEGIFQGRVVTDNGSMAQFKTTDGTIVSDKDCWWEPIPKPTSPCQPSTEETKRVAGLLNSSGFLSFKKKKD